MKQQEACCGVIGTNDSHNPLPALLPHSIPFLLCSCPARPRAFPLSLSEEESEREEGRVGLQLNLLKARPLFSSTGKTSREEDLGEKKWRISKNFNIRSLLSTSPLTYRTPRPFVGPPLLPSCLLPLSLLFSQVKHEQSGRKGRKERRKGRTDGWQRRRRRRHDGPSSGGRTMALLYLLRLLLTPVIEGEEGRDGHREGRRGERVHALLAGISGRER